MKADDMNLPTVVLILPSEIVIDGQKKSFLEKIKPLETDSPAYKVQNNYEILREPLGIESIAAYLRENGFLVDIVFFDLEKADEHTVIDDILRKNVLFVGFSVLFDLHLIHALRFSGMVKKCTNLPIFFGGALASFVSKELLFHISWIDGVIIGEGELTSLRLAETLRQKKDVYGINGLCCRDTYGKIVLPQKAEKIGLCELPPPARDYHMAAKKRNIPIKQAAIYTSRGCPEKCVFCTGNTFTNLTTGKAWRYRDAFNVVDEIEQVISSFSVNYFYICDDNFVGYGNGAIKRIENMVDELIKRGIKVRFHCECRVDAVNNNLLSTLKKGGFVDILLGIEAGVDTMLDRWEKSATAAQNRNAIRCVRENGLNLKPGFILFDKYTSLKELEENLRFIKEMELNTSDYVFDLFNPMQYFHGSGWDRKEHKGMYSKLVDINNNYSIHDYAHYLCDKSYEIQDERVRIFWETISLALDELGTNMNLEIPKALFSRHIRSGKSKEVLSYIGRYKSWRKDIGDILIEMSLLTVESIKKHAKKEAVENEINMWYRNMESHYFNIGMVEDFRSLLI